MNTRFPLIRAALAVALAGAAFGFVHTSPTATRHAEASMSVDAQAPLHATLLPVVSVFADATQPDDVATMRVAATNPLSVTLLPTVHVSTHTAGFSLAPTIVAAMTPMKLADAAPALRTPTLPR